MFASDFWKRLRSFNHFLKQWFATHWRSLLTLLIGVYLPLQVFTILALQTWQQEGGLQWDVSILMAIHATVQPALDTFALKLTPLGVFWGVVPVTVGVGLVLFRYKRWRALTYLLVTLLGSALINVTAKGLLHRSRPNLWESSRPPKLDFSFPSGHAMSSMTLVAVLIVLTWNTRWRWWMVTLGSLFVVGIGWTRLYLGVHFPSDVIAGWMISIAWAIGVSLLVQPNLTKTIVVNEDDLTNAELTSAELASDPLATLAEDESASG